jgi:hypothetical protein
MVEVVELSLKKIQAAKSSEVAIRADSSPSDPSAHTPASKPSSDSSKKKRVAEPVA